MTIYLAAAIVILAVFGYFYGRQNALSLADGKLSSLHSRPGHYGSYVALLAAGPALALVIFWSLFEGPFLNQIVHSSLPDTVTSQPAEMVAFFMEDVVKLGKGEPINGQMTEELQNASGYYQTLSWASFVLKIIVSVALAVVALRWAVSRISPEFRARNSVETVVGYMLWACAAISILTTAGIVFSVLVESIRFFGKVPFTEFMFGLEWSPQTALRADQVGSSGAFGAVPLFAGTFLITFIAIAVAGPIGMLSAMYLSEYASPAFRSSAKPVMEILAGIPTVVYGFFAALTVAPMIRRFGESIGLDVASESALAAGLVMGIMIIPFISSLADDAISAVPKDLRNASLGLGATRAETISKVVVPAALPGIIAGFLLAISRAIGETMIVVMAAGLAANLTANPLEAVTTVTVQIVTLLVGDQEFDSAKTLAAFALGLVLFVTTLILNVIALHVMQTYREKYD